MYKDGSLLFKKIYIVVGYTDLRNNIDGLSYIIERKYKLYGVVQLIGKTI